MAFCLGPVARHREAGSQQNTTRHCSEVLGERTWLHHSTRAIRKLSSESGKLRAVVPHFEELSSNSHPTIQKTDLACHKHLSLQVHGTWRSLSGHGLIPIRVGRRFLLDGRRGSITVHASHFYPPDRLACPGGHRAQGVSPMSQLIGSPRQSSQGAAQ
jgi:hypothetical protein